MTQSHSRALAYYDKVLGAIDRVVSWLIIMAMAVLSIIVVTQVFFRYVLNDSLIWGWDIPRFCFIVVIMLSIPLGIRRNAHVGIDLLVNCFGTRSQSAILRFNAIFMIILSGVASYYGVILARDTWDQMMPGIQLSVGLFYVALAVGQFHTCLHVVRILILGETSNETLSEL